MPIFFWVIQLIDFARSLRSIVAVCARAQGLLCVASAAAAATTTDTQRHSRLKIEFDFGAA